MAKKEKRNLENIIRGIILIPGFWIIIENDFKWQFLLGLIIGVYLVPSIIIAVLPDKLINKKKTNSSRKANNIPGKGKSAKKGSKSPKG